MCNSVHAARAGFVESTETAGESSVLVGADRWGGATASGPSGGMARASRRTGRLHAGIDACRLLSTAASVLYVTNRAFAVRVPGKQCRPACSIQKTLAFARAHMADTRRPSRIATQAAVSSVSAAIENVVVERVLGARNDLGDSSGELAEERGSRTASARSERGEGFARSGGRIGGCRPSVACVRCADARWRGAE
eukprot:2129753-Pleurochrysis_carterae.AAC.2